MIIYCGYFEMLDISKRDRLNIILIELCSLKRGLCKTRDFGQSRMLSG